MRFTNLTAQEITAIEQTYGSVYNLYAKAFQLYVDEYVAYKKNNHAATSSIKTQIHAIEDNLESMGIDEHTTLQKVRDDVGDLIANQIVAPLDAYLQANGSSLATELANLQALLR